MKKQKMLGCLLVAIFCCLPVVAIAAKPDADVETQKQKTSWHHLFAAHFGYANMVNGTAGLTDMSKSHEKDLCSGISWDVRYAYRVGEGVGAVGFGALYSGFTSKGAVQYTSDHVYAHYIAPQATFYLFPDRRINLNANAGIGGIKYLNESVEYGGARRVTSGRIAGNIGAGAVYHVSKHVGLSLDAQYVFSALKEIHTDYHDDKKITKFPFDHRMGVSRLNISAGLNLFF